MGGFVEIVWSVFDIDRACAALMDVGGFVRTDLPDAGPDQAAAWHLDPAQGRIQQAMLSRPGEDKGRLRLVQFDGWPRDLIRPSQRIWDSGGIFDLDLFTRDARGAYRALVERHGWTAFGEPVDYVMGAFDVTQVVARGPDGVVLAIIEPRQDTEIPLPPAGELSRVFNSTQLVHDMDRTLEFYVDRLGWTPMMSMTIGTEHIEPGVDVLGLPLIDGRVADRRVAIVHPDGQNDGSIELIEIAGLDGRDCAERAVAPHVGLLCARIPVEDAEAQAALLAARGQDLYTAPTTVTLAGLGTVRLFSVRSPDGAILEFFQPL
jgi:catechol 2,3-dioxygenase-like lactoylglutathione lyase family enzyme